MGAMLEVVSHLKSSLSHMVGGAGDALHIPVGLVIFGALLWVLRRRKHPAFLALVGLGLVQSLNEVLDASRWPSSQLRGLWQESVKDSVLTMAAPVLITGVVWVRSRRQANKARPGRLTSF